MHPGQKSIEIRIDGSSVNGKHRAVAASFNWRTELSGTALCHRFQFYSVPKVEGTLPGPLRNRDLRAFHIELVLVHNGPDGSIASWPLTGIDTRLQHWCVR